MTHTLNRRNFIASSLGLVSTFHFQAGKPGRASILGANDRLNLGVIGVNNRGQANWSAVHDLGESIRAWCDVDLRQVGRAVETVPTASVYQDFRKMLDREKLDAVIVSTADHTHAVASCAAIDRGLHVYCEKPLTHTVHEARVVNQLAQAQGVATQMGTQIHAGANYRRVVEAIQANAIGEIQEVHVWVNKNWSGSDLPTDRPAAPKKLDWDLWLGPAKQRPYHPTFHPGNWRRWWDFGGGTLADMACHYMDLPFWALNLDHPTRIEADGPPADPHAASANLRVRYQFPKREGRPGLFLTWYDGNRRPEILLSDKRLPQWGSGVLFVGTEGLLISGYSNHQVFLNDPQAEYLPPEPSISDSVGHHREWIDACKTGSPTTCHFGYSGPLTETVLLGIVSHRVGQAIDWDSSSLTAPDCTEAEQFLKGDYRKDWGGELLAR